jgi:FkbM family methyltransferase
MEILKNLMKFLLTEKKYQYLRRKILKKTPAYIKNVYGFNLYQNTNDLDYSKYIGLSLENINRSRDSDVLNMAKFFLNKGDTAVDIGANIGLMSLAMSQFVGVEGLVVSIEPGPVSFGLLRANKFINKCSNIILVDAAVSDVDVDVSLFINPNGESDNQVHKGEKSYNFKNEQKREMHLVKGITLDNNLLNYCNLDTLKFIKIDTQGHEWYVLNGARKLFEKLESLAILCEFAPYLKAWEIVDIPNFFQLILDMNFTVYDLTNLKHGVIDLSYLEKHYGSDKIGKYTDLLLVKGGALIKFEKAREYLL